MITNDSVCEVDSSFFPFIIFRNVGHFSTNDLDVHCNPFSRTMKERIELLDIREVADRLRLSPHSVTKKLQNRRRGVGNFPLPLTAPKCKARWNADAIEEYIACGQSQSVTLPDQPLGQSLTALRERHGI
jgi:predicted DNA-binding transcriptional regulator AlpA